MFNYPGYNYPTVQAWHRLTGSHNYYIKDQVEMAKKDNAPLDATFKRNGSWVKLTEVENKTFAGQVWESVLLYYQNK